MDTKSDTKQYRQMVKTDMKFDNIKEGEQFKLDGKS